MSNGKQGERLFSQIMQQRGNQVRDVSGDQYYFDKDIDFFLTNATGEVCSVEVKWCERIGDTGNLFLEYANPRSKQWSGEGWWLHCKADFLAYGDAQNKKFYIINMAALRERVDPIWNSLRPAATKDNSKGRLLPLWRIKDLYIEI